VIEEFYDKAATVLKYSLLSFDAPAREEIAGAFDEVIEKDQYTCYACAILPDHVHILIRKHKHRAEQMLENLKEHSRLRLSVTGHRDSKHPAWTAGIGCKVFLEHPDDVRRTIGYIERNPLPYGLPIQQWKFVKPYDGWPLHPGHDRNSPYVVGLRAAGQIVEEEGEDR
jgi:REP element-mobilizing transposase RayT